MLNSRFVSSACMAVGLWMVCFVMPPAMAQTSSSNPAPPPNGGAQTGGAQSGATQQSSSSTEQKSSSDGQDETGLPTLKLRPTVDQPQVKDLGGGGWFSDNVDWFHWGPVGIRSAEVFYTHFAQDATATAVNGAPLNLSVTTLQADIAYSQRLRHSRLIWQYSPRILSVDGHLSRQLSNQDSTLNLLFAPTPRMALGIKDWFSYSGADNVLNSRTLELNNFSGAIMNPFLNNGQQTLTNSAAVPLTYNTSARTSLSVSPFFNYAHVSEGGAASGTAPLAQPSDISMQQYGATAGFNHLVSSSQSVGMFYTYQRMQQSNGLGKAFFHSFGATASRRLGRTVLASGEIGGSYSAEGQFNTWTGVGSVALTKSFRHGSLQGTYGRGVTFSGFLGNGYSNYGWVNADHQLGRKVSVGAGFGYLTGPTLGQQANGKYVNGTFSYAMFRNVSWFVTYANYWQAGKGAQLATGTQTQIQAGLRWAPPHRMRERHEPE